MRWAGYVTRMGVKRNAYRIFVGKPKKKEDHDVGGRVILSWILEKSDGVIWTGSIWLRIGTSGGLL
jgi:hypothetical protein